MVKARQIDVMSVISTSIYLQNKSKMSKLPQHLAVLALVQVMVMSGQVSVLMILVPVIFTFFLKKSENKNVKITL